MKGTRTVKKNRDERCSLTLSYLLDEELAVPEDVLQSTSRGQQRQTRGAENAGSRGCGRQSE